MKKNRYQNKNILIIGGSFGIGEALCREFDACNANLAIAARSKQKMDDFIHQLNHHHLALECDVTQPQSVINLANMLSAKWQSIDLIIFCAGTYQPMNIDDFDALKSQEIVHTNFSAFFNFIDAFLPYFKHNKIKHLAVISSVASYFGMPNSLAYGASKSALSHLTESLYYELKKYHTKVQLINPGFVKTRLTAQNTFTMPNMIDAQQAAQIILKKLPKKSFEITFPFPFSALMKTLSLFPYPLRHWLLSYLKR